MSETATTNYGFKKQELGHPPRDTDLGENMDAIDTALKTVADTIGDFGPLASAKIVVGNSEGAAAPVDMSGDATVDNLGEVTIGADKVANTMLENMVRGSVKVGGDANAPTDLDAKGDAKILVGDATDVKSVAVSGDVTIDNLGEVTIGPNKVVNTMLDDMVRGTVKVGGAADAPTDLDAKTAGQILIGDDTDLNSIEVTGDVTITDAGVTAIGAGKIEIANLEAALKKDILLFGEVDITETTIWKIEFPFKVTINKVNSVVSVALSAHETTVTLKNNGGTSMTNGIITIASEAAKGDVDTASPTEHNVIDVGEDLQLVSNGACTTGKAVATIHYTRTA